MRVLFRSAGIKYFRITLPWIQTWSVLKIPSKMKKTRVYGLIRLFSPLVDAASPRTISIYKEKNPLEPMVE